jgi:ferredoxin
MCLRCVDVCPHKAAHIRLGRRSARETLVVPQNCAGTPGAAASTARQGVEDRA